MKGKLGLERLTYREHLLVVASATKTILMLLFGSIFIVAPTPEAFRLLRLNGVGIPPAIMAILIFSFALCYPTLLAKRKWTVERRHQFFLFGSAPVFLYFFALVYINIFVVGRLTLGTVAQFAICILFLILPSAIFYGYRRAMEVFACLAMAFLMILAGVTTAFTQNGMIFSVVNADFHTHIYPMSLALIFLASGISYFMLIFFRNLDRKLKTLVFGILALPVTFYGILLVYNALRAMMITSLVLPLVTVDLSFIIALVGFALYQPVTEEGALNANLA